MEKQIPSHGNTNAGQDDWTDNESADPKKDDEPMHAPAGDSHDDETKTKTMSDTDPDDKPKHMHDKSSSSNL